MTTTSEKVSLPRDLGDGLVLRRATPADVDPLTAWSAEVFSAAAGGQQRYIMEGRSLIGTCADFTIVEDTATHEIFSSLGLLHRTWTYDGIPFDVGQPEFVLTKPAYRRRGLIRAQMDVVHAWSAARGDLAQVIGGIPHYYRQFGYAMALEANAGRVVYTVDVPTLAQEASEPFLVRPATEADASFIHEMYTHAQRRYLVAVQTTVAYWTSLIWRNDRDETPNRNLQQIITTAAGVPIGYLNPHLRTVAGEAIGGLRL